jgi:hypothetical protein
MRKARQMTNLYFFCNKIYFFVYIKIDAIYKIKFFEI